MVLPNQQVEVQKMSMPYLTETNNNGEDDQLFPSSTRPDSLSLTHSFVARKRQLSVSF
jgi:hypothetical protein